uniref:Uncharacterized protein LOC104241331 n=1 Tax=Nicotiana sylvestris TaxID=4096 RepID=A0A1U7XY78_NICSY|nr:PREDICTED: uncharacterized protein LOC104241331 [Nicotiana sylvestris]
MAEDCELWDIICDSPYVPIKVLDEFPFSMEKTSKEYTKADKKAMEKNFRAKKILVYGLGPKEYDRISTYDTAKEIWEALQIAHEGTTQAKMSSSVNEVENDNLENHGENGMAISVTGAPPQNPDIAPGLILADTDS